MASGRRSRGEWEKFVAEAEREGSIEIVAARHGVVPKRLVWWRWWLAREKRTKTRPKTERSSKRAHAEPRLLPIELESTPVPSSANVAIEIEVRDIKVRVEFGTAPAYVAALVGELRRC
jgi:transposase-like protein